ncbi:WD repeat-containing protein 76 [Marmota marmota marmota]|uniref:WD repeat-containing protein 76 n=1 Tax=Marmota marmota marmota TaxID=9994 RepID=UPI00209247C8|nr:WD repeat-containing protein 76 [Marmota marmota marmota]
MSRLSAEAEEKACSRQRNQVKVNEYKENQNVVFVSLRPEQTTVLGKTAKVYLAPFSLTNYKLGQFKCPKSLLEKNSNDAVMCKKFKKTQLKKTCKKKLIPKMKAISSKAESTLQKSSLDVHAESNKLEHKNSSDAVICNVDMESSDEDTTPGLDDFSGLSPYERKRLKNISENANFFASLQLSESAARLREMIKKRQPPKSKRKKPKKRENEIGCRRSMRLLKVDPSGVSLPATPTQPTLEEDENPLLPPGPLEMIPENQDDNNELFKEFLQTWGEMNKTSRKNTEKGLFSIKSYKANLNGMVISEDAVHKVTNGSIFSVALHPSETRTLVAAGAKSGQIGLWDLVSSYYFLFFFFFFFKGIQVYRNERSGFSSFDFLTEDASTLLVGHWDGNMSLVDRRTPGTSFEKLIRSSLRKIRTVHVHPVHRQYFMTAGLRDIHIYDVRHLKLRGSQPLISLTEHTKSIASAYFSPVTGNRVVTTCADCKLRVFDSSCISSQIPLLTTIRHNTITGRWLTRFQAVWDPKQEDCILVGSMAHPRRVEIFHETGKRVHSFLGECLASVCSINVMHPTRYILAGGNSSGKLHVFMN